ncbi:transcription factor HIVEP2 [Astyanax mexicanus]|uniref:Transcription factor HIVEP3 n=1 Tax=Astyanax mexicanus TaxID=7994 RepID=A0A8T2LCZ6_ASTMX|nr:transcription factor HIVEP2 [Astyanax mexicanus]XP_007252070.3 transcription factor HIVEP2 [Astyanax mexicanus]KAG9268707.1 transcription factor HIVEP2-like isoform X1 [Astyanax mexicanus]
MDTSEPSVGARCSQQGASGEETKSNPKMTQKGHISDTEGEVGLTEKPQAGELRPCSSSEIKTVGSEACPTLQPSEQYPIHSWSKTHIIPPPGKRGIQLKVDLLSEGLHKKEQKPKKTGKYVCHYCGRACAKPSVLKKHIRSHTGERPYPCVPCGFSFKTKSNLYKHRKSHTHAVKAGLIPFSEHDSKRLAMDEELGIGEGEMQSDAEQSTDTDEELIEETSIHVKGREDIALEESGKLMQNKPMISFSESSLKKDTLSPSGKISLWQFREMMPPAVVTQVDQEIETSTIKQRLALRLSEKKSQESDQSLSLPSSYSKGSTDSGYFSRSESAEQQVNQPSASAKSYQEIMFGKCYRPSSKPRQSITVQTCMTDINETSSSFMIKLTKGMLPGEATSHLHRRKKDLVRSIKIESDSFQVEDYQEVPEMFQGSTELLETPPESGLLLRSNSLPTPTDSTLNAPQALRSSNSFDERMTNDDAAYRGSVGMRKLMRQAAFEHSAHEGHTESDSHASVVCGLKSEVKIHRVEDSKFGIESCPEFERSLIFQGHMVENATRKRRKGKNVMEGEDFLTQNKPSGLPEVSGDLDTKQNIQEAQYTDTDRRAGSNVISVIQHTNSLSRLSSAEKLIDFESLQFDKSTVYHIPEKELIKERHKTDLLIKSSKIEKQWGGSNVLYQRSYPSKQLASQSGIQVPEIRVTEEPDKPENVQVRPKEKHGEEFQWPQRSETLSKFPVEKLPPKKKRLRLAEMECSSGESSFESACTSLSRSPSQDSNLSHSSSFSQSLDREDSVNVASPAKSEELSKPLEFLAVPGGSLSHHREMRRSASEQAPCNVPLELPEFRSKSFDYGYLSSSTSSMQSDIYASASGYQERRRGYLVRQASLTGDPETVTHDRSLEHNLAHGGSDTVEISKRVSSPDVQFFLEGSSFGIEKMKQSLMFGGVSTQQLNTAQIPPVQISCQKQIFHPQTFIRSLKQKTEKDPEDLNPIEEHRIALMDLPKDQPPSVSNVLSTIAVLSQAKPALASQRFCSLLVPVRIQMQVPCYGNMTYTSISHILDSMNTPNIGNRYVTSPPVGITAQNRVTSDLSQQSGQSRGLLNNPPLSPAKLNTGIPLSLTSRTISTTEAPSVGAHKRMLSPASSIELFIEAKQQKRVKDEKMYGQIVEELSAVELGHPDGGRESRIERNVQESTSDLQDSSMIVEEIDIDDSSADLCHKTELPLSSNVLQEAVSNLPVPVRTSTSQSHAVAALPRDIAHAWILSQFPSLHTTTCVSWCYLNSTKPNSAQTSTHFSVYATWFVRSHNPNPPTLSTGMVLALLRSKQRSQNATYTIAAINQPGVLVTSALWNQKLELGIVDKRGDDIQYDTPMKSVKQKNKCLRENSKETETSVKQTESVRIKIFEGGYKSNEEYVYVRGRGRGKYICEECGIRCKKPSMLKKHIRTHTDVRPYVCKCCNFAFKTKGNLTKHMKSKAHMKKCLELGVSPMAMDNTDDADHEDDVQKSSDIRVAVGTTIKHQFSDADDSDGGDEDGEEPDDEEDDEYDGDSTPRTLSRSTSPQPCAVNNTFPSSCFTRSSDSGNTPRDRFEASSLSNEDDFSLEQASSSFDPCPPHLLSPCWDSPHQRYMCPRGDLSPQGHLSPGRDTSPLRAISPRRDLNIRGDLSPNRQLSPVRPISPGTDVSRHRAPSPRGRHRGMLRAASPRRGSYQHRAYMDQGRGMRFEASSLRQTIGLRPEMDQRESGFQSLYVSDCLRGKYDASTLPHRDIFSHLPLHSQWQVPTPIPMVPVGGLRMPSVPPCGASVDRHSQSLPEGDISEGSNSSQTSVPVPGPGTSISSQKMEKPTSATGLASRDKKQEESVQICAQAIASLRITSEENPPKS